MDCNRFAVVYSKPNCPECVNAKLLLETYNICVDERIVGLDLSVADLVAELGPVRSVPQIVLDGAHLNSVKALRETLVQEGAA